MKKLLYFLFGFITALFAAVVFVENQGWYFLNDDVYDAMCTIYSYHWYYTKLVIIALFVFCVLSFVFALGSGYKEKNNGYEEIKPE